MLAPEVLKPCVAPFDFAGDDWRMAACAAILGE
jgi:hypothetical protein